MRITILLLLIGICLVSTKYLPYDESDTSVLVRNKRSEFDKSVSSINPDGSSDIEEENKEEEAQRKLEEKQAKEKRKEEEKREKEEHKRLEKIEKLKRKEEEKQRKLLEKKQKEETKIREKELKQLEKLQKEALENSEEDDYLATKKDNSIELSDIWRNHIYIKYGLNLTSTKSEKQAAIDKYLQEELGLNSNSTESDRRQAIMKHIETKLQTDIVSQEALKNELVAQINTLSLNKWQAKLEKDINKLNNKSEILKNFTLPGANVTQQKLEEKKSFLQTISKFLSNMFPSWINSGNNQTQLENSGTVINVENSVEGSNGASSVSNTEPNDNVYAENVDAPTSSNINDNSGSTVNGGLSTSDTTITPKAVNNNISSASSENNQSLHDPNSNDSVSSGGSTNDINSNANADSNDVLPSNVDPDLTERNDATVNNNVNTGSANPPVINANSLSADESLGSDTNIITASSPSEVIEDIVENNGNIQTSNVTSSNVQSEFSESTNSDVSGDSPKSPTASTSVVSVDGSFKNEINNDMNSNIDSSSSGVNNDLVENTANVSPNGVHSESSSSTDSDVNSYVFSSDKPNYTSSGPEEITNNEYLSSLSNSNSFRLDKNNIDINNNLNVGVADSTHEPVSLEKSLSTDSAINGNTESTIIKKNTIDSTSILNTNSISYENSKDATNNNPNVGSTSLNSIITDIAEDSNIVLNSNSMVTITESTTNLSVISEQYDNILINNGDNGSKKNDSILSGANNSGASTDNLISNIASSSKGNSNSDSNIDVNANADNLPLVAPDTISIGSDAIINIKNQDEIPISVNTDLSLIDNSLATANIEFASNVDDLITAPTEANLVVIKNDINSQNVSHSENSESLKSNDLGSLDVVSIVPDILSNTEQPLTENDVTNPDAIPNEASVTPQSKPDSVVDIEEIVSNVNTASDIAVTEIFNDVEPSQ